MFRVKCGCRCRADPSTAVRPDNGVVILRCRNGTCVGASVGGFQTLAGQGECLGLMAVAQNLFMLSLLRWCIVAEYLINVVIYHKKLLF